MTRLLIAVFFVSILVSGCLDEGGVTSSSSIGSPPDDSIREKLSSLGFNVYGIDEFNDSQFGETLIVGMTLEQDKGEVNRQALEGFKAMHSHLPGKEFYMMELSDDVGVVYFGSRGDDLRDFSEGRISRSEWDERNRGVMDSFYSRLNSLLGPGDGQVVVF